MTWLAQLEALLKFIDVEGAFLIFAAGFIVWVAIALARRGVDPSDLVIGPDGRMEWHKLLACVGGTAFTWGFIHVTDIGQLTEWFFYGFGVICFGSAFAYKVAQLKTQALMPPRDTTTTTSTSSTPSRDQQPPPA